METDVSASMLSFETTGFTCRKPKNEHTKLDVGQTGRNMTTLVLVC